MRKQAQRKRDWSEGTVGGEQSSALTLKPKSSNHNTHSKNQPRGQPTCSSFLVLTCVKCLRKMTAQGAPPPTAHGLDPVHIS